jgi:hypothetical protein
VSSDLLAAVRTLVELINRHAASGLLTRELIIQAGKVQQLLARAGRAD